MNAKRVNAAADVINRAIKAGKTLPATWATALETACLLQSPEIAKEQFALRVRLDEVERAYIYDTAALKKKVAELEAAAYGDAEVRLLDPVGQIRHLHAALSAQMSRADTLDRLCRERDARVAELLAERHTTNEALSEAAEQLRVDRDRIAELEALKPAPIQTCRTCGAGYDYGQPCSTCQFRARMAAELAARHLPTPGELAEQRHLVDPLDHVLEALAPRAVMPEVAP